MTGGEGRRELEVWWREQRRKFSIRHLRTPNHPPVSLRLRLRSPPTPLFSLSLPTEPYHLLPRVLMMLSLVLESPESLWQYQPTDAVSHTELSTVLHVSTQRTTVNKADKKKGNPKPIWPNYTVPRQYNKGLWEKGLFAYISTRGKWVYSLIEPPSLWW